MDKVTISAYQFFKKFPTEAIARQHLEQQRWNGCVRCPHCDAAERIQTRKVEGYYRCLACKFDFTVRTGTMMERSHIPLTKWMYAVYLVATARKGISSMQLSKELGITQKSAWFLLQRIREACGNGNDAMLSGIVEVDETYIGGKETNRHESKKLKVGGGTRGKTGVIGLRERGGHVRTAILNGVTSDELLGHIDRVVKRKTTVCTDDHKSYHWACIHFNHKVVCHSAKEYVNGMAHTNGIESVWALLKRGFYGTYHQFSQKHLQRYVDEVSFRLNEGNCKVHTMDRVNALFNKGVGTRVTYEMLVEGV